MYIHCSIVLVLSVSLSDSLTWYNRCYSIQNKRMLWDLSHAMKVWEHWKAICRQKDSSKLDPRYFLSPSQILLINVTVSSSSEDFIAETFSQQNEYFSDWKVVIIAMFSIWTLEKKQKLEMILQDISFSKQCCVCQRHTKSKSFKHFIENNWSSQGLLNIAHLQGVFF